MYQRQAEIDEEKTTKSAKLSVECRVKVAGKVIPTQTRTEFKRKKCRISASRNPQFTLRGQELRCRIQIRQSTPVSAIIINVNDIKALDTFCPEGQRWALAFGGFVFVRVYAIALPFLLVAIGAEGQK